MGMLEIEGDLQALAVQLSHKGPKWVKKAIHIWLNKQNGKPKSHYL